MISLDKPQESFLSPYAIPKPIKLLKLSVIGLLFQTSFGKNTASIYMTKQNTPSYFKITYSKGEKSQLKSVGSRCGFTANSSFVPINTSVLIEKGVCTNYIAQEITTNNVDLWGFNTTDEDNNCMEESLENICKISDDFLFGSILGVASFFTIICCSCTGYPTIKKRCKKGEEGFDQGKKPLLAGDKV